MAMSGKELTKNLSTNKSSEAFRTIREVAEIIDVPQHVLRFWESKFRQVNPLKRGGGRRYYRPDDVILIKRIKNATDGIQEDLINVEIDKMLLCQALCQEGTKEDFAKFRELVSLIFELVGSSVSSQKEAT